ncbi:hypothetical protein SCLCIDRAFT_31915 [Scleroderma citrinum Foug A]|uniref:Uncharacterized protein n=1 Tax=Scleroderma citrinum Foug A TaxID=1036808 RepID=A0A0C3CXY6_9AGAM|nr:hypothetical protein SCLCIDRAFT_31915 [Scleroderma citrinum Foug A]
MRRFVTLRDIRVVTGFVADLSSSVLPLHPGFKGLQIDWIVLARPRYGFDVSTLTLGPMDPMAMLWGISTWLRDLGILNLESSVVAPRLPRRPGFHGFHVDRIVLTHPRFNLDMATLMALCNESVWTVWMSDEWLHDTPDPDLYRSDFDPIALTPGSNDPIGTFQQVSVWLHEAHAFEVGLFNFFCLTNVYSFDFEFFHVNGAI